MWLCDSFDCSHLLPGLESTLSGGTIVPGTQRVTPWLEMARDEAKRREKALCLCGLM